MVEAGNKETDTVLGSRLQERVRDDRASERDDTKRPAQRSL